MPTGVRALFLSMALALFLAVWVNAAEAATYMVKPGDCLWLIAQRYGTTVQALMEANGLKSTIIYPGQVLTIPGGRANRPAPAPSRGGGRIEVQRLLDYATSLLGTRYRWAGESPETGFDCSGFVKHVFGRFGVYLPHSADAQSYYGVPVSRYELKPGDLLFFCTEGYGIDHVGIYLGEGRFIHASSSRGCVRCNSLYESYWSSHFVTARRLI